MKRIRHFDSIEKLARSEPALNEDRYAIELRAAMTKMKALVNAGRWKEWHSYEAFTDKFVQDVKDCRVFADVGAEVGFYTYMALKHMAPGGKIYAFEPDPVCSALLSDSFEPYKNVTVCNCAVYDSDGTIRLVKPRGTSPTCADVDGEAFETRAVRLDDFFQNGQVDLIKIDIEGAEAKAFDGMKTILSRRRTKVFLELHSWVDAISPGGTNSMERLLSDCDYRIYNWDFGQPVRANRLLGTRLRLVPHQFDDCDSPGPPAGVLRRLYLRAKVNYYLRARRYARFRVRGY